MDFTENSYYQEKFFRFSVLNEIIEARVFEECEFQVCSFINCKFEKCKFLHCELKECTFSAINPHESRFLEVKFYRSKVIGFDWAKSAKVEDLEFTDCQINYSNFKLLKVPKIKIINCQAKEVDFIETDMNHGTFKNTDFEKSRFLKTDLSYSDFSGAKNYSINLLDNNLKKAKFNSFTRRFARRWPTLPASFCSTDWPKARKTWANWPSTCKSASPLSRGT